MASWNLPAHHADSGEDQSAEADDRARIDGEGFEGGHQRGRAGEVHRPLGMGHADKRERKKGWSHRADGREKCGFEGLSRQPVGGRNEQPITTGVASEDTSESIHFAPPLTQASALGQS